MDLGTVDPDGFGRSLTGLGLNLLVRDVKATCAFLNSIFDMTIHQPSEDFAIVAYKSQLFQLHADGTYAQNPLLNLLPENPPRGAGIELRLFESDPDQAAARATAFGATILQPPTDKPHGLRETYILDSDGYAWVPSLPKKGPPASSL